MENKGSSAVEITLSFLLGTATGFILGVLFAPAEGKETRKKIREQAEMTGEKAREKYEQFSKDAEKGMQKAKVKSKEGIDAIKDFVDKKKKEIGKKTDEAEEEVKEKK
ncbi:MAG: hypothetical protein GF421_01900 [Candidatus Aminicenantes bacterium]|nr:hypothetical protein [Candidatus Aminicenantes bacterium]